MNGSGIVERGLCECGNKQHMKGLNKNGIPVYRSVCTTCHRKGRRNKRPLCDQCGFIAEDLCQIDIDHIDGNVNNNDLSNLANICSNCHRLKTKKYNEWRPKKWRENEK